jgi:hypothetical protein
MKNRLFAAVVAHLVWGASLFADPIVWNTAQIPVSPSNGVNDDVVVSSGPNAGNAVAVWGDNITLAPYYSIYNNGTWTTGAIDLSTSSGVSENIYVTAGPGAGELIATWKDSSSEIIYFSHYSAGSWTTGQIPLGLSIGTVRDVTVASGPNNGQVTAVWADADAFHPFYSIYSGGTWSDGAELSAVQASNNVFVTPGPTSGTLIATWNNFGPAYYALYSGGSWGAATTIPLGGSGGVSWDVITNTNPSGQVAAVWSNGSDAVIYYSFYNGGVWSPGAAIDMGSILGCYKNPYIASELTGEFVLTWNTQMTRVPSFSIYQNGMWSVGAEIPLPPSASVGAITDVTIGRTLDLNTMIAAWGDNSTNLPYYSTFAGTPIPPPPVTAPLPPTNGQGSHVKNRFALLIEWYNQLSWTASISPNVTGYNIRRNGTLIATNIPGTSYRDNNRPKNGTDVYLITSVNAEGSESLTGLEITVSHL